MKKLRGGFSIVLNKDKTRMFSFSRNTVYVNSIPDYKCIATYKSLSNISYIALSHDETMLAAKNTSGTIEILEYPSGVSKGICKMKSCEGYAMQFTEDDKQILDFDWNSHCMLLDISTMQCSVFHKFPKEKKPYIYYNPYSKSINALLPDDNVVMQFTTHQPTITNTSIELSGGFSGFSWDFTFSQNYNIFYLCANSKLAVFNDKFEFINTYTAEFGILKGMWLSESENLLLIITYEKAILFDFPSMTIKQDFVFPYISGAAFIENESKIAIATWSGTFIESISS